MPWTLVLSNQAVPFLNANHPPENWTSNILEGNPLDCCVYFFRKTWWQSHKLQKGNYPPRNFPAFHWFASTYKEPNPRYCSGHQIVCATRLEVGLIPEYNTLPPLPPAINQWFNHADVPTTRVAWNWSPNVKDIGTFQTLDETIQKASRSYLAFKPLDRPVFDPSNCKADLPFDVWQQIKCFFLSDPAVTHFLNIP